ncbi:uncharacterized protein C8R40DRAFT_714622 [Lentinula edodes]|uniref:uncharacterized protein n=1 Tax=Lentinula edodes TaxID=5353 RepID=UPI001E8E84ED|nr:uncharacterized protein C8R40DRAFT_714622 [Lentinula edodes]KAH7869825.1 hypothetical protein C8R40DRAFT_714622 [Lentinula edodes]
MFCEMIRKAFLRAFCVSMDGARSENWHVPTCPEFPECHASQYPDTSDISMFGCLNINDIPVSRCPDINDVLTSRCPNIG